MSTFSHHVDGDILSRVRSYRSLDDLFASSLFAISGVKVQGEDEHEADHEDV